MTPDAGALRKITAIVRTDRVEQLEKRLRRSGVPGMTIDDVKGYGEYPELIDLTWLARHARIEIVVKESEVPRIVDIVLEETHTGLPGDGIVYVEAVAEVHRIRDGQLLTSA